MQRCNYPRTTQFLASVLAGILTLLPLGECLSDEQIGIITGDGVTTRAGPGVEYEKAGRLHTGDHVTVLEQYEKWLKIVDPDGRMVWVFASWVDVIPVEPKAQEQPPEEPELKPEEEPLPLLESEPVQQRIEPAEVVQETLPVAPPPLVEEKGRSIPWIWIGAGATVAGALGYALLSTEETSSETGSLHIHVEFP